MELDTDSLKLLALSAASYSNGLTAELFKYQDVENQVIFDNKTELAVLLVNVKHLSVLIIRIIEALEVGGDSDEVINDIGDTATTNLNFSEQMLGVMTFVK
jgi:hypothetical protein